MIWLTHAHLRRALVLGIALPALLLGSATALVYSWRERLPDPVALHWGPNGMDSSGTFTQFITPVFWVACGALVLCAAFVLLVGRTARRLAVAMAVGTAVLLSAIIIAIAWVQLDVARAEDAPAPTAAVAFAFLGAIAAAAVGALLAGQDPALPATAVLPSDAAVLDLPPGTAAVWVRNVQMATRWLPWAFAGALIGLGALLGALAGDWWVLFIMGVTAVLGVGLMTWHVQVDATGLSARGGFGWPRQHIPANEVERAVVVQVQPLKEFGGWGMRAGRDGTVGLVTRAGEAIRVQRSGGRTFVVTVDDASVGAALLNTMAERSRSQPSTR